MKHLILENKTPVGKEILDGEIIGVIYQTEDGRYVGEEYEYPSLNNYYAWGDDGNAHKLTIDGEQRTYTCDDGYIPDGRCNADGDYFSYFEYENTDLGYSVSVRVVYAETGASSRIVVLSPANETLTDDDDNDITVTTVKSSGELEESELEVYDGDGYYNTYSSNAELYGKYEDTGERRTLKYGSPYLAFVFRKVSNSQLYFGLEFSTNLGYKHYMMVAYSASTTPDMTVTSLNEWIGYYNVVKKVDYMKSAYPGVAYNLATKKCTYNPMRPSLKFTYEFNGSGVQESTKFDVEHIFHVRYGEYTYAECGITQSVIESYREKIRDGHYFGEDFNITVNGLYPNLMRTDSSTYTLFHCGRDYVLFDDDNERISVGVCDYYSL